MRLITKLLAVTTIALPAAAQAMTVQEFLDKAAALKAKGVLALGSSDITLLRDEIKSAGAAYRADLARQTAAGKKPSSCPPPVGKTGITSDEIIKDFSALPAPQRKQSVKAAWAGLMARRYPC